MTAPVIGWLVEAMIASTLLMVVVLLLRAPVRKAFGADVAYALWLLPVLRLALPPLPAAWHEAAVAPMLRATEQMTVLLAAPAVETAAAVPTYDWLLPTLALLWVPGAGAFIVWHTLAHHRFCRRMIDQAAESAEHDGVRIIETSAATGPLAFGIWRRYVAFPRDFTARFEVEERDLALAHELGHHARGDLIANWIALVVLGLHWFNPIAWRAFRAFRADQEIANDARVLAGLNPMRRHVYACAILKAAHGGSVSAACHLHTIDDLKGRLKMLTTIRTSRARLIGGSAAIFALTLGGLGMTASGSQAAERMRSGVKQATGVDIAALAPPTPPAPPVVDVPVIQADPKADADTAPEPRPPKDAPMAPRPPHPAHVAEAAAPPAPPEMPVAPRGAHDGERTVMITTTKDGKTIVRRGRYVKLDHDGGATLVGEIAPIPPIPPVPMPEIVSKACGTNGKTTAMVIRDRHDGARRVVVCTDRIAIAAARGAEMAANSSAMERNAYVRALDGLRRSRARMIASDDTTMPQQKAALAGIDVAIAELEADLARLR
uniref:M56 family metallopeptidase n=1 Tax=uncultured Sphingomonas sp. TaxID=158754 RepID=UPI0035CABF75